MRSNETSRQAQAEATAKSAPKVTEAMKEGQVQGAMKLELMRLVMESRMSRLENYKLTGDSKFWDKDYPERIKKIQIFLTAISGNSITIDTIQNAANNLGAQEKALANTLISLYSGSIEGMQQEALKLMRADNGSDQVEAVAARNMGDLFEKGVKKLEGDSRALGEIKRRANIDFGKMLSQGAFDNATPEVRTAIQAGMEAMYQMRYIAKNYIDEKGGIPVPDKLKGVWENYRDSLDIKDEWFTISDTGKTQFASFLLYDLAPMIVSGGVAGAVGKGIITVGSRGAASLAARMPAATEYLGSTARTATVVRNVGAVGGRAGVAVTEAVVFDATFEGIRNQRWFTEKPSWQQDMLKNALGFGFSRYLAGAKSFAGMKLDPASSQLIKQGLIVPAIITGAGVAQKLMENDPEAYKGAWEEFLLGAIMIGAFHTTGKVIERRVSGPNLGIEKIEISNGRKEATVSSADGKKFHLSLTDKLRLELANFLDNHFPRASSVGPGKKDVIEKGNPNMAGAPKGEIPTPAPTAGQAGAGRENPLPASGSNGEGTPRQNRERVGKLEEMRQALVGKVEKAREKLAEFTRSPEGRYLEAKTKLESIPRGTGETGIKIEGGEYTINTYPKNGKVDVVTHGIGGVKTYNSIEEFLLTIYGKNVEKMLKFDHRIGGTNYEMRVVKYKDGTLGMEVKDGANYRPLRGDEAFIPREGTEARRIYDEYMKHQRDLFNTGMHNVVDTPESMRRELSTLESRLGDAEGALSRKQARPARTEAPGTGNRTEYDANGRPIDRGAQSRIDQEHRIGTPAKSAKESAEVFGNPTFRKEMDAIMKMDDATFQKKFTETQYRDTPLRPYEKEMFAAAANVRKHSDATIIANAPNIIRGNREFLGAHGNRSANPIAMNDKAYLVAENAALRSRLQDIVGRANPVLPGLVDDAVRTGNPVPLATALRNEANKPSNLRRWWPLLLFPLIALAFCSGDKKPKLPGEGGEGTTPEGAAEYCAACGSGPESTLDFKRRSEANNAIILTEKRREDISKGWMKTSEWTNLVTTYTGLKSSLARSRHPLAPELVSKFDAVLKNPTVKDVQQLQKCVSMFDKKTLGKVETLDHMGAQDGILGPITTAKILSALRVCTAPPTPRPAPSAPSRPSREDPPSELPDDRSFPAA